MMTANTANRLHIYLLAGVKSSATLFTECIKRLEQQMNEQQLDSQIDVVMPYGEMERSLVSQLFEVSSDLSNRKYMLRKVGGKSAFQHINDSLPTDGAKMLLIGHSGGGAAAYQAAKLLETDERVLDYRVVMIGSPRIPIVPEMQNKVSYFHAIDNNGQSIDPICRLGSWGGWCRSRYYTPHWKSNKYSPGHIEGIVTVGGHKDYFRHEHPYVDDNKQCNLEKMMNRVQEWLKGWL
ncbi:hypothetical protein ACFSTH_16075 [Paenibacillus yanchengensis]|uniref:Fungal lipase-like domain-containing protein n=1 Tax=Paenibacillus yanchengensis TaxID=2035833 RepID=A0ABW4YHA8_9BACL